MILRTFVLTFVLTWQATSLVFSNQAHSDDRSEFSRKCDYSIDGQAPTTTSEKMSGVAEACANAQASYKTWKAAEPMAIAWTAVAGVCLTACIASQTSMHTADLVTNTLCTVADLGATVADAATTQDLASSMAGLIMPLAGSVAQLKQNADAYSRYKEDKLEKAKAKEKAKADKGGGAKAAAQEGAEKASTEAAEGVKDQVGDLSKEAGKEATDSADDLAQGAGKKASKLEKVQKAMACMMPVISAGVQAGMKYAAAKSSKESFSKQLLAIRPENTEGGTGINLTDFGPGLNPNPRGNNGFESGAGGNISLPGSGGGGADGSSSGSTGGSGATDNSSTGSGDPCRGQSGSGKIMACAVSLDKNLPPVVGSPVFAEVFKKNTGKDLDQYLAATQGMSPKEAMLAAAAGTPMPASVAGALASSLEKVQSLGSQAYEQSQPNSSLQVGGESSAEILDSTLTSGGGSMGGGGASSFDIPPFDSMMQDMLSKFMPQMGQPTEKDKAIAVVVFANQKMSPASIAENRKLSIFDRVTYRYLVVGKGWYPINRPASSN